MLNSQGIQKVTKIISPRTLQNPVSGPPKLSPEASKTSFLKDLSLKNVKEGNRVNSKMKFGAKLPPSWVAKTLQLEAKTRKNQCCKTTRF